MKNKEKHTQSPHPVLGGSGSGKLSSVLSYNILEHEGAAMILDPKKEHAHVSLGQKKVYVFNPLGVLSQESPTLEADAQSIFENLMDKEGSS